MATTFYLRLGNSWFQNSGLIQQSTTDIYRGSASTSTTANTVSSGTWVSLGYWIVRALEPFTLSGTITMNLWGEESNNTANASLGLRVHKLTSGNYTQLLQINSTTELATSPAVRTATGTPTSTAFGAGDFLVFEVALVPVGTMGGGRTGTVHFNGPTAAANGDSYVTITENVNFTRRVTLLG